MNIGLYKGLFIYDAVNYFVDELCKAFKSMGHSAEIIDLRELGNGLSINKNTDMVLAFNVIGAVNDNQAYDKMNAVFGALLVDHPFYTITG